MARHPNNPPRKEDEFLAGGYCSIHAAAKSLGVGPKALHRRIRQGTLKVTRFPGSGWLWIHITTELNRLRKELKRERTINIQQPKPGTPPQGE